MTYNLQCRILLYSLNQITQPQRGTRCPEAQKKYLYNYSHTNYTNEIFQLEATARLETISCSHGRWVWLDVFAGQSHKSPLQSGKKEAHGFHLLLVNKPLKTLNKTLPSLVFFGQKSCISVHMIFIFTLLDLT